MAAQKGHTEALRVLIGAGGDPNKTRKVSILLSERKTREPLLLFLFEYIFSRLSGRRHACLHGG